MANLARVIETTYSKPSTAESCRCWLEGVGARTGIEYEQSSKDLKITQVLYPNVSPSRIGICLLVSQQWRSPPDTGE